MQLPHILLEGPAAGGGRSPAEQALQPPPGLLEYIQCQVDQPLFFHIPADIGRTHAEGVGHVDAQVDGIAAAAAVLAVQDARDGRLDEGVIPVVG